MKTIWEKNKNKENYESNWQAWFKIPNLSNHEGHEGVLQKKNYNGKKVLEWSPWPTEPQKIDQVESKNKDIQLLEMGVSK